MCVAHVISANNQACWFLLGMSSVNGNQDKAREKYFAHGSFISSKNTDNKNDPVVSYQYFKSAMPCPQIPAAVGFFVIVMAE